MQGGGGGNEGVGQADPVGGSIIAAVKTALPGDLGVQRDDLKGAQQLRQPAALFPLPQGSAPFNDVLK